MRAKIVRSSLVVVLAATLCAKVVRNPAGFKFDIPNNWTAEHGEEASVLLPPGVKIDPMREDNPELYTVYGHLDGEDIVEATKQSLRTSGIKAEGTTEPFRPAAGKAGVVYTLNFKHPKRQGELRLRIWTLTVRGKHVSLVAMGLKDKVMPREAVLQGIAKSLDYGQ